MLDNKKVRLKTLYLVSREILKVGRKDFKNHSLEYILDEKTQVATVYLYSKNKLGMKQVELRLEIDLNDYVAKSSKYKKSKEFPESLEVYLNNEGILNKVNICVLNYVKSKLELEAEEIKDKLKETQVELFNSATKDNK